MATADLRTDLVGDHYERVRRHLVAALPDAEDPAWHRAAPTCPGWDVHDVVAHLVGITQDAAAGTLSGPPDEATTAAQVARHRATGAADLLATWDALAPGFAAAITERGRWEPVIDILNHEHDLAHALGRPARRDDPLHPALARMFRSRLNGRVDVVLDGADDPATPAAPLRLRTTSFELVRLTLGRRTPAQVRTLDWSADPGSVVNELFVFGPAAEPIEE